jgi:ParB family chromosome partitioning protein
MPADGLKILQKLAAEGVIDADHPVPCLVKKPAAAVETSLMENTVRAAMHPADEFVAMAALIEAGATIEDVATRFGTSERHVRQRLRLGKLAPELLDAFRAGDISLEVVTGFTLGADHAAQLAVWRQVKDNSYIQSYTVKRLLTESAVALDSDLGLFVGAEAYEAAGGTITRDLFSGDEDGFLDDAALVRRLAIEKLEAKAARLSPAMGVDQGNARSRIRLHGAVRARATAAGRNSGRHCRRDRAYRKPPWRTRRTQ